MCSISDRPTSGSDGYSSDESVSASVHIGYGPGTLIKRANKRANLLHIINKIYGLKIIRIGQFSEWSRSISCPFPSHKGGAEQNASFGYNFVSDYFHCFGCNNSGGAVEFLSLMESVPKHLVAEQILRETAGYDQSDEKLDEDENPRIEKLLFEFSDFLRALYQTRDAEIIKNVEKITWYLDPLLFKVSKSKLSADDLEIIIERAKSYLEKFTK